MPMLIQLQPASSQLCQCQYNFSQPPPQTVIGYGNDLYKDWPSDHILGHYWLSNRFIALLGLLRIYARTVCLTLYSFWPRTESVSIPVEWGWLLDTVQFQCVRRGVSQTHLKSHHYLLMATGPWTERCISRGHGAEHQRLVSQRNPGQIASHWFRAIRSGSC